MSFKKASTLVELAVMVSANRTGVTFRQIEERFQVSYRTAQRMADALRATFPDLVESIDDSGHKRLKLPHQRLRGDLCVTAEQLASVDLAIDALRSMAADTRPLIVLRDEIISLLPDAKLRKLDVDHEALLEAQGFVARPGPRPMVDDATTEVIATALKGCRQITFVYGAGQDGTAEPRQVAPYGLLSGLRRYLVGASVEKPLAIRIFRVDRISALAITSEPFARPLDFDLHAFAKRGFGAFITDDEYGEVLWKFRPEAADHARTYLFHPEQIFEDLPDGSLLVRFAASGQLEMCWHLYSWGDSVEVLAPTKLKAMVEHHRRSDFPAYP